MDATVGGGVGNTASGRRATVGGGGAPGGFGNTASGSHATVGGGRDNEASNIQSTVAGGDRNEASGDRATVGGGALNRASGGLSIVGGGSQNKASGSDATVGGGTFNTAEELQATVGGGRSNTASGEMAAVPGGRNNEAAGDYSFAAGREAKANHDGALVFGDSTEDAITSNSTDEARFQMEVFAPEFHTTSARAAKTNVEPVDPQTALEGVDSLEISTWEFRDRNSGRHMGPMAGEFAETFGLGTDDESIATVDADGVTLAAIQGLSQKLEEKEKHITNLEERLSTVGSRGNSADTVPADD